MRLLALSAFVFCFLAVSPLQAAAGEGDKTAQPAAVELNRAERLITGSKYSAGFLGGYGFEAVPA